MHYATNHKVGRPLAFHLPAVLLGVIMIYPLVWMLASSLKPNEEVFTTVTSLIPSRFVWDNYVTGWQSTGRYTYATYFKNSFIIALGCTLGAWFPPPWWRTASPAFPSRGKSCGSLF